MPGVYEYEGAFTVNANATLDITHNVAGGAGGRAGRLITIPGQTIQEEMVYDIEVSTVGGSVTGAAVNDNVYRLTNPNGFPVSGHAWIYYRHSIPR